MRKKYFFYIISTVLILIAGYKIFTHQAKNNYLTVSGRVEADEIEINARIPGKLESLYIQDGSQVKKDDILAVIEDKELQSKSRQTLGAIDELNEKIRAAGLDLDYTVRDVEQSIDEADKLLSIANARVNQAESRKQNAEKEFKRYSNLIGKEVVPREKFDSVKLSYELAREDWTAALKEAEKAQIAQAKAENLKKLVNVKKREILAMNKALGQMRESLEQVNINIGYSQVKAPSDGTILRKVAEAGEVLFQGSVIGIMINPRDVHVKTYVPEKYVGRISMDMKADVFTDAYPDHPFSGVVCFISDKSEFTPKEVQSYEERIKQVFAVKICFSGKDTPMYKGKKFYTILKKGMPVDVRFPVKPTK
jgi:HlyD family secretion protein